MAETKLLTPQQELFLAVYCNPKSDTFGNAYRSALKANYSEEYSQNMISQLPDWLSTNISDMSRLRKAEKVLDKTLEYDPVDEIGRINNKLLKTQTDVAKFYAGTVGKSKYSTRQELTGADGKDLVNNIDDEQLNKLIKEREQRLNSKGIS